MEHRTITAIYGMEPKRDGEFPLAHIVGGQSFVVHGNVSTEPFITTAITRRTEGFGNYGISWFDVSSANGVELSVQAFAVAEVHYAPEGVA